MCPASCFAVLPQSSAVLDVHGLGWGWLQPAAREAAVPHVLGGGGPAVHGVGGHCEGRAGAATSGGLSRHEALPPDTGFIPDGLPHCCELPILPDALHYFPLLARPCCEVADSLHFGHQPLPLVWCVFARSPVGAGMLCWGYCACRTKRGCCWQQGIAPFGEDICVLACALAPSSRRADDAEGGSEANGAPHEAEAQRPEV